MHSNLRMRMQGRASLKQPWLFRLSFDMRIITRFKIHFHTEDAKDVTIDGGAWPTFGVGGPNAFNYGLQTYAALNGGLIAQPPQFRGSGKMWLYTGEDTNGSPSWYVSIFPYTALYDGTVDGLAAMAGYVQPLPYAASATFYDAYTLCIFDRASIGSPKGVRYALWTANRTVPGCPPDTKVQYRLKLNSKSIAAGGLGTITLDEVTAKVYRNNTDPDEGGV